MTLTAQYLASKDKGQYVPPRANDFSIYSFNPSRFWCSKASLPLSKETQIVRYDFRGHVRCKSGLKKPGLQIKFIDSYSPAGCRLQGVGHTDSFVLITTKDSNWDAISTSGALAIKLNISDKISNQILNKDALDKIRRLEETLGANQSLVMRPTQSAHKLKTFMSKLLNEYQIKAKIKFDNIKATADIRTPLMSSTAATSFSHYEEKLAQLSQKIIQELGPENAIADKISNKHRRRLALEIEELLWKQPNSLSLSEEIDLAYLSEHFDISRRTIQVSIHEQFGVGFIDLRRTIRLHQIRAEIIQPHSSESISSIAHRYFITHLGRLSREYKNLFGELPSRDVMRRTLIS